MIVPVAMMEELFKRVQRQDDGSIIARFSLHSCDGGIGSGIATAGIIALRCIREKCERLLVADEASHDQYRQREWSNQPGMTFCTGTLFMGVNLPEMLNQQCLGRSLN
jgi:hypothetical protein